MNRPVIHHIPVCPFSQRLEILLSLKGAQGAVDFSVVDITRPRDPGLLAKMRGATALPALETQAGAIIRESLVILRYLDESIGPGVAQADPYRRAVENMLIAMEGDFASAGYRFILNRDRALRGEFAAAMDAQYGRLDDFLRWQAPARTYLFDGFGLAEAVFAPLFARFQFLDYYEGYDIPVRLARVRAWRDACLAHESAQQVSREEIVKLYFDYAMGAGNGALPPGRCVSSFAFEPHWSQRPWPPRDKWSATAGDEALGLLA
ncbi:MAG: glutathione S-transferase family protein [Beijerinckiaceae bacterium]